MWKLMTALSFAILCIGSNAQAGPKRVLTAIPRAVGRTAENMVTFRDRQLAIHQWILVAAVLANSGSEINLYHRCSNCHELDSFVYGLHPSAARLVGIELLAGMSYATIQQAAWESSYEEHSRVLRSMERLAPTVAPALVYTWFTYRNTTIPSDGSLTIGRGWLFPN
jgi:hypothetical protein